MVNICDRWAADHTQNLQFAFFNGVGFESWENVWGIWRGITPRNGEAIRRIATIERFFSEVIMNPDDVSCGRSAHDILCTLLTGPLVSGFRTRL